jgi:hypothetical protein
MQVYVYFLTPEIGCVRQLICNSFFRSESATRQYRCTDMRRRFEERKRTVFLPSAPADGHHQQEPAASADGHPDLSTADEKVCHFFISWSYVDIRKATHHLLNRSISTCCRRNKLFSVVVPFLRGKERRKQAYFEHHIVQLP